MANDIVSILGIPVDSLNMKQTVDNIFEIIEKWKFDRIPRQIATVNVDFVVNTLSWNPFGIRHPELLDILLKADMITPDGMPILWAAGLLGTKLKERVTGADLVPELAKEAAKRRKSIYFLGGRGNIGAEAARILKDKYPDLIIAGTDSPFVHVEGQELSDALDQDREIVERINRSGADILLIGFGNPKQEIWFDRNRHRLEVPVSIGIGGTYEFIAGTVARAPRWMQKTGMEWVFRITQDPGRLWKRYFVGFLKFSIMIWPAVIYQKFYKLLSLCLYRKQNKQENPVEIEHLPDDTALFTLPRQSDTHAFREIRDLIISDENKDRNVIIDLSRVDFINSAGLGMLLDIRRICIKKDRTLFIAGLRKHVKNQMVLNRVLYFFKESICENKDEALNRIGKKDAGKSFYFLKEQKTGYILISLYGVLDASEALKMKPEMMTGTDADRDFILNFENLDFIDSSGLGFLLRLYRHLEKNNKTLLISGPAENVMQLFRITKTERLFKIFPDLNKAENFLNSLNSRG